MAPRGSLSPDVLVWLIYALVVLYAFCYQLQAPLEPFLVDRLVGRDQGSSSTAAYGRLQSFFMVVQTVGSLTFGHLLDRAGMRVGFIVNFSACALTYLILANTSSLALLYLSKLPGVGMAGFLCAQTAVSQLTPEGGKRVAALGRLTTAYTVGGVVGPYIGGLLGSKGDYFLSAKIAVAGSLFAVGLSCLLPPPQAAKVKSGGADGESAPAFAQLPWVDRARTVLRISGFLVLVKLATSTANSMSSSTQSLVLKNELGFSEADLGLFMSCHFAFGGVANGFLLAPVTRMLGGHVRTVVQNCIAITAVGYFVQAAMRSEALGLVSAMQPRLQTYIFIGIAMLLSVFQYSLGTSITAESTQLVPKDMKGTAIGIEHSIFAGARIFTPAIGIGILNSAGAGSLYMACGAVFLATSAVWATLAGAFLPVPVEGTEKKTS